jgi:cytochrome bd-type quinol oxidase subunit 1
MKDNRNKTALFIGIALGIFVFTMILTKGRLYKTVNTYVTPVKVIAFDEKLAGTYNNATVYRFILVQDNKLKYKIRISYDLSMKLNVGDTVNLVETATHYKLFNMDRVKRIVVETE